MDSAIYINNNYQSIVFSATTILTEGLAPITLWVKMEDNEFVRYKSITKSNTITKIDFSDVVQCRLTSCKPFNYTIPNVPAKYLNKTKIEDFLYEITYGNIDYNYAKQHFIDMKPGGCSSLRKNNLFGRNFDWFYNNDVLFVVHTPTTLTHNAVLGVSGIIPGITKTTVDLDSIVIDGVDMFKLLPFYLLDGINEHGLFCSHNVVPLDNSDTPTVEIIAPEEREKIAIPMLVRYILDNFKTAEQAINYITRYVTLYFTDTMIEEWNYLSHFLIGDTNHTYTLEFINGEIVILSNTYITNFPVHGVEFDIDNKIQYPPTLYGMNAKGFGLERWNLIAETYSTLSNKESMRQLLINLYYSNAYKNDFRLSEFVGYEDDEGNTVTVDTLKETCTELLAELASKFAAKTRTNPLVGITCHSSLYDLVLKLLYITNQENENEYNFTF